MDKDRCKHEFKKIMLCTKDQSMQKEAKQCIHCKQVRYVENGVEIKIDEPIFKSLGCSVSGKIMDKDQKKAMMESNDVYGMV